MTEKADEVIHRFFCSICGKEVFITALEEIEDFRIGIRLLCPSCFERIAADVVNQLIRDTSIPKTYRKIFEQYLRWREKK